MTKRKRRPGALTIETAIALPVLLFILLAIIVGGMGVFRYQLVACQAREAARYACVRGADYQVDKNSPPVMASAIYSQVILPMAIAMDPSQLAVQIQWMDNGANTIQNWDGSPQFVKSVTSQGQYVTNSVRVTVTYYWMPEWFLGSCQLQSVSQVPMSN